MHQYKLCNTYIHGNQIPHGMGVFLNFNRGIISPIHTGRILMKYHMDIRAHIMRSACDKKIEHRSKVKVTENTKITLAWHQLIRCLQLVGQNAWPNGPRRVAAWRIYKLYAKSRVCIGRIRIGAQSVHFCSVHAHFVFGSKSRANRVRSISLRIFCKAWNSSLRKFAPCTLTLYSVRNYIYIYMRGLKGYFRKP